MGRSSYTFDFFELPLLLRTELTLGGRSFYAMAGAYGSVLLRADETDADGAMSPMGAGDRVDVGLLAAGGVSLATSPRGHLFAELRYQHGFQSLLPSSDQKHQVVSLLLMRYGKASESLVARQAIYLSTAVLPA
ncbi:outer membrane beta-barrel protein [Haliangium sp.]|uniref:outer membrane beta-barrel protein n=1 Tax=Haliangium sp. TaxID=2663208 RepID=UPI003D0BE50D